MKKSRLLSALLAIVMLATVFSVAGIGATALELPADGYVATETIVKDYVWNKIADSSTLHNSSVAFTSPAGGYVNATYYEFTIDSSKFTAGRFEQSLGANGEVFSIDNFGDLWVSFDLESSASCVGNTFQIELRGKYNGTTAGDNGKRLPIAVTLTGGKQHVCVPVSSLTNYDFWETNGYNGIHAVYYINGKNYLGENGYAAGSTVKISNLDFVTVAYAPKKTETENTLSDIVNVGDANTYADITQDMRFQFKESIVDSTTTSGYNGGDLMYSDFTVTGNGEWEQIIVPCTEMTNGDKFDGVGAWTVTYTSKRYNTFVTDDTIEFADLKIMRASTEEGVEDTVVLENFMNLPGNANEKRMVNFAKETVTDIPDVASATSWKATLLEDYDGLVYNNSNVLWNNTTHQKDFTYSSSNRKDGLPEDKEGLYFSFWVRYTPKKATTFEAVESVQIGEQTYSGAKITVDSASRFNKQKISYDYEFAAPLDATDVYENANLNLMLRLTGTVATNAAEMIVRLDSRLNDGTTVSVYAPVEVAASTDWQTLKIPFENFVTTFAANEFAKDNIVGIAIESVTAEGTPLTVATNDTIEIAGVNISKTVNAPVNASAIDLKISKVSLTLQDNLTMNFKVAKSLFDSKYANPYVMVGERKLEGVLSGDYYVFSYDGISPQNIRNTVSATVYATYGGAVIEGKTLEYSVKKYCDTLLASGAADEQTRTLIVDLLNYGAAAQEYTGVRVNNLANINLTTEQAGWGTAETPIVIDHYEQRGEEGTVKWESAGLALDDSVIVNLQFNAASKENLKVVVSDGTNPLATYEGDDIKSVDGDSFLVSFDGLNAKNMRRLIYVTVYDGETAVSNEVVYSVESYVRQVADLAAEGDASVDAKLVNLVNAMIKYGDAALVYAVR